MAETYHGTEIPEDIWLSWTDPNSSEAAAWRRGVRAARGVCCAGTPEDERLDRLAPRPQAVFEELPCPLEPEHCPAQPDAETLARHLYRKHTEGDEDDRRETVRRLMEGHRG